MNLVSKEYCCLIEDAFAEDIIAGYTNTSLKGDLPDDLKLGLSYLNTDFEVDHLKQQHSNQVNIIDKGGLYIGDALFTKEKNLVLVVRTADCLPLYFYSAELGVIGAVHMGWRSAKDNILENIKYDLSLFNVVAGAGLRGCCYEVGDEFFGFNNMRGYLIKKDNKTYLDIISFAKDSLVKNGLKGENFFDIGKCTLCSDEGFFSYRKSTTESRMLSFILRV